MGIFNSFRDEYTSDQYSNLLGKLIKKFSRKDVKKRKTLTLNYSLQKDWQNEVPSQDPIHFIYVIFERDMWPAQIQYKDREAPISLITFEPSAGIFPLNFRSAKKSYSDNHYEYVASFFTNTLVISSANQYAGTGLVENPDIGFNTSLYY